MVLTRRTQKGGWGWKKKPRPKPKNRTKRRAGQVKKNKRKTMKRYKRSKQGGNRRKRIFKDIRRSFRKMKYTY